MAVTITPLPGGSRAKKWLVTFGLDGDTTATIQHGMTQTPELVPFVPLNTQVYVGQVARTGLDAINITLTKNATPGSGGAQVELIAFMKQSVL